MSNVMYPLFKQRLLSPGADLVNGLLGSGSVSTYPTAAPLKAALVAGYSYAASCTAGSISGNTFTVGGTVTGFYHIGMVISGGAITAGTTLTAGSGTSWTTSGSAQTIGSTTITGTGSADQFESAISASIVGTPQALTTGGTISVVGGQLTVTGADDVVYTAVTAGSTINGIVLYMDTGTAGTSPLVEYIDTLSGSVALSIITNGGSITVNWQSTAPYIFSL